MTNVGGDLGARMADQRYLWSVLPCLMAWPTVAMPVPQAAGIQVGPDGCGGLGRLEAGWDGATALSPARP